MGNIAAIASIADNREKTKEIAYMVQKESHEGDNRKFSEILQEEIDKFNKEKERRK